MALFSPIVYVFKGIEGFSEHSDRETNGRTMYDLLNDFLIGIPAEFHSSIAMIHLDDGQARLLPIGLTGSTSYRFPAEFDLDQPQTLDKLIWEVTGSVLNDRSIQEVEMLSPSLNTTPVIVYIAQTTEGGIDEDVTTILRVVQSRIGTADEAPRVFLYLTDPPDGIEQIDLSLADAAIDDAMNGDHHGIDNDVMSTAMPFRWLRLLLARASRVPGIPQPRIFPPIARFTSVYSELLGNGPNRRILEQADLRFAVAEALFALTLTGFPTDRYFEDSISVDLQNRSPAARIGNITTSMIRFPRAECVKYSAAELGAGILDRLVKDLEGRRVPEVQKNEQRGRAKDRADRFWHDVRDSTPRLGLEEDNGPALKTLQKRNIDTRTYTEMEISAHDLFTWFSDEAYEGEALLNDKVIVQREGRAWGSLRAWREKAAKAWRSVQENTHRGLGHEIDALWLGPGGHVDLAQAYVEQLCRSYDQVQRELANLRKEHKRDYIRSLETYRRLGADRRWRLPTGQAATGGTGRLQLQPSGANPGHPPDPPHEGAPPVGGIVGNQPNGATNPRLDEEEHTILANLIARMHYFQASNPQVGQLVATGFMASAPLTLLLVILLAAGGPITTALWILSAIIVVVLMSILGFLVSKWQSSRVKIAERDVLAFLKMCFLYRVQQWEDGLRAAAFGPSKRSAQRIRQRLDSFQEFMSKRVANLHKLAMDVNHELFNGSSYFRDILIGNRRMLEKGIFELPHIYRIIRSDRETDPREEWHRSEALMGPHLQSFLLTHRETGSSATEGDSVLEMPFEEFERLVSAFAQDVNVPYLRKPELVRIHQALEGNEGRSIWIKALNRSRMTTYQAIGNPTSWIFIAGQATDCATIPGDLRDRDMLQLRTDLKHRFGSFTATGSTDEWLTAICYWPPGGEPVRGRFEILPDGHSPTTPFDNNIPVWEEPPSQYPNPGASGYPPPPPGGHL